MPLRMVSKRILQVLRTFLLFATWYPVKFKSKTKETTNNLYKKKEEKWKMTTIIPCDVTQSMPFVKVFTRHLRILKKSAF